MIVHRPYIACKWTRFRLRIGKPLPKNFFRAAAVALCFTALSSSASALEPQEGSAADNAVLPAVVKLSATNSTDVSLASEGDALLDEFRDRAVAADPTSPLAGYSDAELRSNYKVLDLSNQVASRLAMDDGCHWQDEFVVVASQVRSVAYVSLPEEDGGADPAMVELTEEQPCPVALEVTDAAETDNDGAETEPGPRSAAAPMAAAADAKIERYNVVCFARVHYDDTWNDGCADKYVERNDGNKSYNYYGIRMRATCDSSALSRLTECGIGQRREDGSALKWVDWAPTRDSDGDCRTIDLSISFATVGAGGSYTHCDEKRINKYSQAGKFSSYFYGNTGYARDTQHKVTVSVCQTCSRPNWTYWSKTNGYGL